MELATQVWPEVDGASRLFVPLGSTEQHGPHLPLDTDARIATAIAMAAAEHIGATVSPTLPFGASGEHAAFAGTLSIGTAVLHDVIVELVRSASLTFDQVTLVNGHGGNADALQGAVAQLQQEGHAVTAWWPRIPSGDAHAGRTETAIMLALHPDLVRFDRAEPGNTAPLAELLDELRDGGVAAVAPNGVLGDPAGATAAEGQALVADLVASLVTFAAGESAAG